VNQELAHIWSRVQAQLALVVDEPTYRIWLEPLRPVELLEHTLVIEAPEHTCRWTKERFGNVIHASVELTLGTGVKTELIGVQERARQAHAQTAAGPDAPGHSRGRRQTAAQHPPAAPEHADPLRNPRLTFDQFVIGDSNRLAHAAALTVAEMPAHAYNPLFICGPPGIGKTHLLSSIANLLLTHNPELTVRCTTGESFTNEFLGALTQGHTDAFKLRFRDVDVLLVDDVQFLERKARTEEEFFHTFNALHDSGRQLVLTSDRPPRDLQDLEDRLRERFQAGLVADVQAPDLTTRLAILRKRVQHDDIPLSDERVLDLIAERVQSNVRALEGALIRTIAFSSLTGRELTLDVALEVLDGLYPQASSTTRATRTVADIKSATCQLFGLTHDELVSSSRSTRVSMPRQLAMYLARELTDESLPAIGRHFGGRDHTTVMHACRRTSARIEADTSTRQTVEKLERELGAHKRTPHGTPHDRPS
jgi:chromosomal replication initiator protein